MSESEQPEWQVYMLRTQSGALYTGITTDIARRVDQHRSGQGGAKFFRRSPPTQLAYLEGGHDRSSASRREAAIKKLNKSQKEQLVAACQVPKPLQALLDSGERVR